MGGYVPGSDGAKSVLHYFEEAGQCLLILCRIASACEAHRRASSSVWSANGSNALHRVHCKTVTTNSHYVRWIIGMF